MADRQSDTVQAGQSPMHADEKALAAVRRFLGAHGRQARAVVENLGRAGARVVLIGDDGAVGDVVVPHGPAAAEALVETVDGLEAATWDADTVTAVRIGSARRRAMAGPRARR